MTVTAARNRTLFTETSVRTEPAEFAGREKYPKLVVTVNASPE
jgi:hypothetical protein